MTSPPLDIEELVEKLEKLAIQQADVNGDPSYHEGRMLMPEDTMYWAAKTAILTLLNEKRALEEALLLAERADQQHINCPECDGEGQAEECGNCFPLADDARLARWAALGINQKETAKILIIPVKENEHG